MHGQAPALTGLSALVGGSPLLVDRFTDANGVGLAAHGVAPINSPAASWTVVSGTLTIQSNRVAISGAGYNRATVNAGVADCTVQTIVNDQGPNGDSYAGVLARCSDANNHWTLSNLSGFALGII